MEKDQLDSLATVAVGSEKMPPSHSHYAPSEVYSASESPPAYTRPPMKSTAVQIARIIATTLIVISLIIGGSILASAWLQARASCTPESLAALRAQMNLQQSQNEFIKHLQPEALVQDREVAKDNLQHLSESSSTTDKDEVQADTKNIKIDTDEDGNSKSDNDNGDQNDSDDDYDDSEFPPVHIKLPLQLDLDDIAGSLLQQARSIVSCVVERRRSDEVMDGENDDDVNSNSTERQRIQRLSGERVAILCEAGNPRQENSRQQDQEMLTPIIVPLGTVQIPLQPQDGEFNRYQVHNQFRAVEAQRVPTPVDAKGMNNPLPINMLPPQLRNLPQVSMEMGPPPRMVPQPHMMRAQPINIHQIPIEIRQIPMDPTRDIKPPAQHEQFNQEQQHQHIPLMFTHAEGISVYPQQQQQTQGMMPPPPPQPLRSQSLQESQQQVPESRIPSMMNPPRVDQNQAAEFQETPDKRNFLLQEIPIELRRIIEEVPLHIMQHITGEVRSVQNRVPEGAQQEQFQEFKPFPGGLRPIPIDPFALPIEVRNFLEHGNIEGQPQQNSQDAEDQQQNTPRPDSEEQGEEARKKFSDVTNVMNTIQQIVEGRAFPIPRFSPSLRPLQSIQVPVEAEAQVSGNQAMEEDNQQQEEQQNVPQQHLQARMIVTHEEMQDEANRPHFVQPRSVRSVPEPFEHPRGKRIRRRTCQCAC